VRRTEQQKQEGSKGGLAADKPEGQGDNQGIFTYLQPPMG
jgi:hypothetical protein